MGKHSRDAYDAYQRQKAASVQSELVAQAESAPNQVRTLSTPRIVGGVSRGDVNCQAVRDITKELRAGVGFFLNNNRLHEGEVLRLFEIVQYSTQVVAGTIHNLTVDIGDVVYLKLKVFECLPCHLSVGGSRFEIKELLFGDFHGRF